MDPSVTIITVPAEDLDSFERMRLAQRREDSGGWKVFAVRSGRYLDTFLMAATDADFGVFDLEDLLVDKDGAKVKTCLITEKGIIDVIPDLEALVEINTDQTARALVAHGGGSANAARVAAALKTGAWPESGDPAEETAAFAHQLLSYTRSAKGDLMGVCWEYRGKLTV